jgi:hypothetical protein
MANRSGGTQVTESKAQDLVNGAALVVAAIYFYRKLIEPAAGQGASPSAGGSATEPAVGPENILAYFKGPSRNKPAQPATVTGAAAQLMGAGQVPSTERFVVGWGFVFLTLSLAVPVAPELAGSFAALIALGSILGNGVQVSADLKTQLGHEAHPSPSDAVPAEAGPTTTVSFAGAGAAVPAVLPNPSKPPRRQDKKPGGKQPAFRLQSV